MECDAYFPRHIRQAINAIALTTECTIIGTGATGRDAIMFMLGARMVLAAMGQAFDVDVGHSPGQVLEDARRAIEADASPRSSCARAGTSRQP